MPDALAVGCELRAVLSVHQHATDDGDDQEDGECDSHAFDPEGIAVRFVHHRGGALTNRMVTG